MEADQTVAGDTRNWLMKVEVDLRSADVDMAADPPLVEDVAFHCQQAVEKVFKAFLVWHGQPFRKVHILAEIGSQCIEIDPSLLLIVERVKGMSDYAWKFRYPDPFPPPSVEEAKRMLTIAREVVAAVRARISLPPESAA